MPSSISSQAAMRAVGGLGSVGITMDMRGHPDGWPMVVDVVWVAPVALGETFKIQPAAPCQPGNGCMPCPTKKPSLCEGFLITSA